MHFLFFVALFFLVFTIYHSSWISSTRWHGALGFFVGLFFCHLFLDDGTSAILWFAFIVVFTIGSPYLALVFRDGGPVFFRFHDRGFS